MSSVDFDRVLHIVGDNGKYQTFMFILLCIPATVPVAFLVFLNIFTTATPDHWCKAPPKFDAYNISTSSLKHLTIPYRVRADGQKVFNHCDMYDVESPAYMNVFGDLLTHNTVYLNDVLKVLNGTVKDIPLKNCTYGWQYDDEYYDNTLITELNLVCDYNWFPHTTTSVFYVGSIFGNIFFGWVSDRWGRRTTILWLILLEVLITTITSFSIDHKMYLVMRGLAGMIFPALYHIPFILGIEMMGPKHRTMAGMMICMMFALSMCLLALLAFLLRDWFKLSIATSVPFVLLFSYYWIIPESPRWLLSVGKISNAEKVLESIAHFNGTVLPKDILRQTHEDDANLTPLVTETTPSLMNGVVEKQAQIKETSLIHSHFENKDVDDVPKKADLPEQITNDLSLNKDNTIEEDKKDMCLNIKKHSHMFHIHHDFHLTEHIHKHPHEANFFDIFRYPNIRKKFILLTFDWIANAVVYNGLSYNTTNLGVNDFLVFFIAAVIEIPANLLAWGLMGIWGRRCVLCLFFAIGGLGCFCCVFVPEEYVWVTVTLAMIGKFGIAASFSVFYVFVSESFPTVIRSQAMGFASVVVSIGMLTFPYILQLAQFSKVLPMVILGLISLCAACASIFLPETLNQPMPQTLEDGEKFGKDFKIFSLPRWRS